MSQAVFLAKDPDQTRDLRLHLDQEIEVAPTASIEPPSEPSCEAFCYTVPAEDSAPAPNFVIAGSAESPEGRATYEEAIIRLGETGSDAMLEKAQFVLAALEERMAALQVGWADAPATQVYTVRNIHPFLADEIIARGAAPAGLTWHYARPPVEQLEYEMDLRGVRRERVI